MNGPIPQELTNPHRLMNNNTTTSNNNSNNNHTSPGHINNRTITDSRLIPSPTRVGASVFPSYPTRRHHSMINDHPTPTSPCQGYRLPPALFDFSHLQPPPFSRMHSSRSCGCYQGHPCRSSSCSSL